MRKLLGVFIALALLSVFFTASVAAASSPAALTLINLTRDPAAQRNPSIGWSANGDVIVAWEQNVRINGVPQPDILARVRQNGTFGPITNISNDATPSSDPDVFSAGSFASVLYQDGLPASSVIARSDWSGTAWSTPQAVTGGDYTTSLTPVGVQASDGSIWLARWVRTDGNHSDIIVQQLGGPTFNISNDDRGWRHPTLVAGDQGEVYVGWIDHTYMPKGWAPGMRVARVTTAGVVQLPQPTTDYFAYWSGLAFHDGQLYAVWLATTAGAVRERIWNGSAWGRQLGYGKGNTPSIAATAGGTVYVVWEKNGQIYLSKNVGKAQLISGSLTTASQPALAVDGSGHALVAFLAGGDVWYVQVPGQ